MDYSEFNRMVTSNRESLLMGNASFMGFKKFRRFLAVVIADFPLRTFEVLLSRLRMILHFHVMDSLRYRALSGNCEVSDDNLIMQHSSLAV